MLNDMNNEKLCQCIWVIFNKISAAKGITLWLSVAYIHHSDQSWLMSVWLQNFVISVHLLAKADFELEQWKEFISKTKCGLCLSFWPKLIDKYMSTIFLLVIIHFWPKLIWVMIQQKKFYAHNIKVWFVLILLAKADE